MPEELVVDNPLAIIGDEDTVIGFRALGFKAYAVKNLDDCRAALSEVARSKASVCLVQDGFYGMAQEEILKYKGMPLSIFIPFAKSGETELLDDMIKDIRLKATGVF